MNKTFFVFVNILFLTWIVLLEGCSTVTPVSNIKVVDFKGVSQISLGEKAMLNWSFENADNVRIIERQRNYYSTDSVLVNPDTTTVYNFVISSGADSLILKWTVYVNDTINDITTGPIPGNIQFAKPSFINSDYLRGLQTVKSASGLKKVKIMRHYYPFDNKNKVRANAILLDEYGNYFIGLGEKGSGKISINATSGCIDSPSDVVVTDFKELDLNDRQFVDFALLLDNSSIASDYFPIYEQLNTFITALEKEDRFALYNFNQNFSESIPLNYKDDIDIKELTPKKANGFSAIFKSLKHTIDILKDKGLEERKKAIVVVAYSTDNASIIYDRNDIIDYAFSADIPIYVIGVGNAVDSYSLRSVANLSGARYYQLDENEIDKISLILNEILFSQKANYSFDVPIALDRTGNCKTNCANVEFRIGDYSAYDTLKFPVVRDRHEFNYMALASFEARDTVISDEYLEPIKTLAEVMKQNPQLAIELIGNSSIEGNDKFCYSLGLKRAQAVRRMLIITGADPGKIRVRSDGSNKPLYYLQESPWMQYYNRRVELKWLDPSSLPFEIIAQINDTETEALENVEKWEDQGYRSYYERYLQNNIPVYRVKLWGFEKISDAENLARKLSKEYSIQLVVQ